MKTQGASKNWGAILLLAICSIESLVSIVYNSKNKRKRKRLNSMTFVRVSALSVIQREVRRMKKERYPFVKQHDKIDCGAACVSMIMKYIYKFETSMVKIRKEILTSHNGASYLGIIRGLSKYGIVSRLLKCEKRIDIFEKIDFPVITQIKEGVNHHYIVLYGIENNQLIIGDPEQKKISKLTREALLKKWVPYILIIENKEKKLELEKKNTKLSLFTEAMKTKKLMFVYFILSLIIFILSIFLANIYSGLFNLIIPNKMSSALMYFLLIFLGIAIIKLLFSLINSFLMIKLNYRIDTSLSSNFVKEVFQKNYLFFEQYRDGELVSRFNEITNIRIAIFNIFYLLPVNVLIIVASSIILVRINLNLFLLTLLPIITVCMIGYLSYDKINKMSYNIFEKSDYFNIFLLDSLNNIRTLKNFGVIAEHERNFLKTLKTLLKSSERMNMFEMLMGTLKMFVNEIFSILLLCFGSYLVINDEFGLGTLMTFNAITMYVFRPFELLAEAQIILQKGKISIERYSDIIDEYEKINSVEKIEPLKKININDVTYSYGLRKPIIKNCFFEVKRGTNIAIMGKSGSGKTTLAKLICNYYTSFDGEITFNDVGYINFGEDQINSKILYISQKSGFFYDTLINNLFVFSEASFKKVKKLSSKIGLYKFIEQLPLGWQTKIGNDGIELSLGQAQLLNVIRAMTSEHELIIFDEITSGLDRELKDKVEKYLLYDREKTKIFITHDEFFAKSCDEIYCMEGGSLKKM